MRTLDAIITARGGSVRAPRKNLAMIAGKPLVAWSILQALAARQVTRVWLTTDDDEIADVGTSYGARIIRRPDWMNGTHSGFVPLKHAIEYIRDRHKMDLTMHMMPIVALRLPGDIDNLIGAYNTIGDKPGLKTAIFVIPRHEMDLCIDTRDGYCVPDRSEKKGLFLISPGGCNVTQVDDVLELYRRHSEFLGEEHITDKAVDRFLEISNYRSMPQDFRWIAWAPMKWWQDRNIDHPEHIEELREAWAAFMPKES